MNLNKAIIFLIIFFGLSFSGSIAFEGPTSNEITAVDYIAVVC